MEGKGLLKLPWANEGAWMASFFFLAMLYQSLKRGKVRHLMATLIWTYIFSYAKLKDFTYGLLDTACM